MRSPIAFIDVRRFSRRQKTRLVVNLSFGIVIAVLVHFVESTDWGERIINGAFDSIVKEEAVRSAKRMESLTARRDERQSNRILFIDIDDDTYRKWGKPLITPRDKLAEVVRIAAGGGAEVIIVDILFEDQDHSRPGGDLRLQKVLEDITRRKPSVKIIFPLRIGHDGAILKENLFKKLIAGNPNFHAATANISATAADAVVRYWVPFDTIDNAGNETVLWNISLLAAVLAEGKENYLKAAEEQIETGQLRKTLRLTLGSGKEMALSHEKGDIYRNRIRFLLVPKGVLAGHKGGNLFDTVYRIEEAGHAPFKGKIVIIGNSSPDAGDTHPTPIGDMAGMYVVGNALNTILLGIQPSSSPPWLNVLIEAVVIVLAAFLFLHLHSFLAQVVGSIIVILTLGTFSYYYFYYTGVFLNSVFAVSGMGLQKIVITIEQVIRQKGGRGNAHA